MIFWRMMFIFMMTYSTLKASSEYYVENLINHSKVSFTAIDKELNDYDRDLISSKMNFDWHVGYLNGKREILKRILDEYKKSKKEHCKVENPIWADREEPNLDFYTYPIIEHDGHLWRPVLMHHHKHCDCML